MQERTTLRNLVALSQIHGLGLYRAKQIIQSDINVSELFSLNKSELTSIEGIGEASALRILTFDGWSEVDTIIERTHSIGATILTLVDNDYPMLLKQIYDPPLLLWLKGNPSVLNNPGIAVIGTRTITSYGRRLTRELVNELSNEGLVITSGLAYGVDVLAHTSALEAKGNTVAVLGSGLDKLYPRAHATVAKQIIESGGAVISEYAPGTEAEPGFFPARNRIVSGLSLGTLVIESSMQGGSMITAELALEQNREVFAVPHELNNLNGTGCNYLIKTGAAKLVQSKGDIIDELPIQGKMGDKPNSPLISSSQKWRSINLDNVSSQVCELLEKKDFQIDDLANTLNLTTSGLMITLLDLEIQGLITQKAGKIFELS